MGLIGCRIDDEDTIKLAEALKNNTSLRSLKLSDNSIADPGVNAITNALRSNKALVRLNLNCYREKGPITAQGTVALQAHIKLITL